MADQEEERALAGSSGDDMSAGTSVSGMGGEALKTSDDDAGLPPVHEGGARTGWGRAAAETGEQLVAGNDGTGQSEKPSPAEHDEDQPVAGRTPEETVEAPVAQQKSRAPFSNPTVFRTVPRG